MSEQADKIVNELKIAIPDLLEQGERACFKQVK